MEFVIKNFNKNLYTGELIFYWLERNINFNYGIEKVKQRKNDGVIKLDYHLEGKYRIAHSFKNRSTNKYNDFEIQVIALRAIQIKSKIKKRYEWTYFEIKKLSETDIIFQNYDEKKFKEEERDMKVRLGKVNIEYWNSYWKCLHFLSFIYPDEPNDNNKKEIKKLLDKMKADGISCPQCRQHFINYLQQINIEEIISNKDSLFKFFVDLHNSVNRKLNKGIVNYDKVKELYIDLVGIESELIEKYELNIRELFETNNLVNFPVIHHSKSRNLIKKRLNLFVLES